MDQLEYVNTRPANAVKPRIVSYQKNRFRLLKQIILTYQNR
jgi:hypothetical protein